jgi:hypothetical protein
MDFGPVLEALEAIIAEQPPEGEEEAQPILPINLDPAALLAGVKQQKRESLRSNRGFGKKNKRMEKSLGYLEKMEARDKQKKRQENPKKQGKHKK